MNLFSSFTFGRLIKTFIPGFCWLVSLLLLADWRFKVVHGTGIEPWLAAHGDAAGTTAAFVMCIILGLISNTLIFAGINDALVRGPVRRNRQNLDFFAAKARVDDCIKGFYIAKLEAAGDAGAVPPAERPGLRQVIDDIDVEYVVLNRFTEARLVYVQEQYWYYMELHINLAVAVLLLALSCLIRASAYGADLLARENVAFAAASLVLFLFLVRMARRNYLRHCKKMFSLLCSFFDDAPAHQAT